MAEMMASAAATSLIGSVIGKLAAMLGEKYQLAGEVENGIRSLKDELGTVDAVLHKFEEKNHDQMDPLAKDWRSKVRELSYDIEDFIDRFMLNHSHGARSKPNFVRDAVRKVKMLWKEPGIAEEIQQLKRLVIEQSERAIRYGIHQCLAAPPQTVSLDPRVPAFFQEAMDLVGIDAPREEIMQLLKLEEKQRMVVSIYGSAGQGKTTLAMEVYNKITEAFDCRAFRSVSQTPDMKKIFSDILCQISKSEFNQSQSWEVEQLIRTIREYLMDKRYFILIDDIWSISAWELVRSALPLNDNGSRIISTTRSKTVARSCCTGIAEQMYEARPLSDEDSRRLFFKRLSCSSEDIPQELTEVYHDILNKCGGLPLAIISIAGLLANSQTKEVWVSALKSISAAIDKDIDKMKRILLLSYFDLHQHLKSCLLYLSVFPEDYLIDCARLILLWVAEGLIPGQDREDMEHLGRSYLNELINRSLVQPTEIEADGTTVKECRVHDVILHFIVSKAVEENFVTIWNSNAVFSEKYSSNKIRRLSIQEDISSRAEEMAKTIKNAVHIRSIHIFVSNSVLLNKHASGFLSSQVLRVLNIEDYVDGSYFGQVKSFGQMKYLRIARKFYSRTCKLPENIEKLQHLETVDVSGTDIAKLPECIVQLQKLVHLVVDRSVQLPDGIGKLQALEELYTISLAFQSVKIIQGLGDLNNLRVLGVDWSYHDTTNYPSQYNSPKVHDVEGHMKACTSSLSKLLMSLLEFRVGEFRLPDATPSFMASCVCSPPTLRKLMLGDSSILPHKISSLVHLTRLRIGLHSNISKEAINIIASLPMLLCLTVCLLHDDYYIVGNSGILHPRHSINSQGFERLVKFNFRCWLKAGLEFEPGAMPKLQKLKLGLLARCQFKYGHGGLVLGLQNLAVLKQVALSINCFAATFDEVQALEDDIKGAARTHPNNPVVQVERDYQDGMVQGCSRRPSDHPIKEAP